MRPHGFDIQANGDAVSLDVRVLLIASRAQLDEVCSRLKALGLQVDRVVAGGDSRRRCGATHHAVVPSRGRVRPEPRRVRGWRSAVSPPPWTACLTIVVSSVGVLRRKFRWIARARTMQGTHRHPAAQDRGRAHQQSIRGPRACGAAHGPSRKHPRSQSLSSKRSARAAGDVLVSPTSISMA